MAAVIELVGEEATFDNGRWTCANRVFEHHLNQQLEVDPPQGYPPHWERSVAEHAAKSFGGRVVSLPELARNDTEGRVH